MLQFFGREFQVHMSVNDVRVVNNEYVYCQCLHLALLITCYKNAFFRFLMGKHDICMTTFRRSTSSIFLSVRINLAYQDRQACTNCVDPDQTPPNAFSISSKFLSGRINRIKPGYWDRQAWVNSVDLDQTPQNAAFLDTIRAKVDLFKFRTSMVRFWVWVLV